MSTREAPRGSEPDAIPERIDHYRVIRRIGRGGQGDVFLAHDPHLDMEVAVKVLLADLHTSEWLDRFAVEARTAVRLTAPNIVRVYNFDPRHPYLAMEYCPEGDLNQLVKRRVPLPLRTTASLIRQVLEALEVAHRHDPPILHRDLKPVNVLFSGGVAKVADFGLAKILGSASGLTATRGMMGTVAYASPEQLKDASRVDVRTDLWSVGVMLYELLTFRRPFDKPGDDFVNIAIKVRMEPPASPSFDLPAPIRDVVERALRKDPDERFTSATEMREALDAALAALGDEADRAYPPAAAIGEVERLAADVGRLLDTGATEAAARRVRDMHSLEPEASVVRYWRRRVRERRQVDGESSAGSGVGTTDRRRADWLESRLESIRSLIDDGRYRDARRGVGELLVDDPDNSIVHGWLERIAEQERASAGPPPAVASPSSAARDAVPARVATPAPPPRPARRPALTWVAAGVAAAVVLALAFWRLGPTAAPATHPVTLVAELGDARVASISVDGRPYDGLGVDARTIGVDGVRWSLGAGRYVVRLDDGRSFELPVPARDTFVVAAPGASEERLDDALGRALGLLDRPAGVTP